MRTKPSPRLLSLLFFFFFFLFFFFFFGALLPREVGTLVQETNRSSRRWVASLALPPEAEPTDGAAASADSTGERAAAADLVAAAVPLALSLLPASPAAAGRRGGEGEAGGSGGTSLRFLLARSSGGS